MFRRIPWRGCERSQQKKRFPRAHFAHKVGTKEPTNRDHEESKGGSLIQASPRQVKGKQWGILNGEKRDCGVGEIAGGEESREEEGEGGEPPDSYLEEQEVFKQLKN